MTKTRVAVLRGGPSNEYDISLKTGAAVLRNLPEQYQPIDVLIDKSGTWYARGAPRTPARVLAQCDVVFNALHGRWGEDGKLQRILHHFNVPYTGSGVLESALAMNKWQTKEIFRQRGLKTPVATLVRRHQTGPSFIRSLFRQFPQPSVVKPLQGGSSVGVTIAHNFNEFSNGFRVVFDDGDTALVEEYISGREATCGVIDDFRGEKYYALPPVEIVPPEGAFFDYENKYNGETKELCPALSFSKEEKDTIACLAKTAHSALGLRHYSRSDFIVSHRGIYILEVNTLPGLTEESLLPKACSAVGCSFSDLLDHLVQLALNDK